MPSHFNTILLPVDFSINTKIAISKALEICSSEETTIHLYHIHPVGLPGITNLRYHIMGIAQTEANAGIEKTQHRLEQIKTSIQEIRPGVCVNTWVGLGKQIEDSIAKKAKRLEADIIIIGKHSHHSIFPFLNTVVPSRLSSASGIPVLAAKPGSMYTSIKSVVMPVGTQFPTRKIEILDALRRKNRLKVSLVTFSNDLGNPEASKKTLLDTFRTIKNFMTIPVDHEILDGSNKARVLVKYCNKVGADMLIVHPESETKTDGWIKRHISDLLPNDSRTQILSVQPA
jgi:nucleotide-binding universal stress UspA family protein